MALRDKLVTMAHGGGGKAMRDLIADVFTSVFQPTGHEDQARLTSLALQEPGARLAFTADSFVVTPLEFPGGDNEGRLVVFCPPDQTQAALTAMRALPEGAGAGAVVVGFASEGQPGRATLRTRFGGLRIIDMLTGDQLPRIC